jgi:hypothetical protein
MTGDELFPGLRGTANHSHGNLYGRRRFPDADVLGIGLDQMAELLDILEP